MEHLLFVADAGLIITFFSCGQSAFMQCYSVALNKRLISATVHAGLSLGPGLRVQVYGLWLQSNNGRIRGWSLITGKGGYITGGWACKV